MAVNQSTSEISSVLAALVLLLPMEGAATADEDYRTGARDWVAEEGEAPSAVPLEQDDGLCWRLIPREADLADWTERLMRLCVHSVAARTSGRPLSVLETEALQKLAIYAAVTAPRHETEEAPTAASRFLYAQHLRLVAMADALEANRREDLGSPSAGAGGLWAGR
jgi:hypothetical protein